MVLHVGLLFAIYHVGLKFISLAPGANGNSTN